MTKTEQHIISLAQAAAALGEPTVATEVAGVRITIHADPLTERQPASRDELAIQLAAGRARAGFATLYPVHGRN